jgi:hypothetical protein
MASYGFKTLSTAKGKAAFPTLRTPAGVSPLRSLYASGFSNPTSDVLNSSQVARLGSSTLGVPATGFALPASTSGLGGAAGYGLLNPGTTTPGSTEPSAPKPPAQAPPANGKPAINDLTSDPILAFIQSGGDKDVADTTAAALANAKNAVIGAGLDTVPDSLKQLFASDPSNPILGALTDQQTLDAAKANPDSSLKQLAKQYGLSQSDVNSQYNAGNAFYGSRHGEALSTLADQNRQAQQGVYGSLGGTLGQLYQAILDARNRAAMDYANALPGAYDRFLASGSAPVGSLPSNDAAGPTGTGGAATGSLMGALTAEDPLAALMLAAQKKQAVAI